MPVILTTEDEWDLWLSGETWDHVKSLQRPLPDGTLKVVGVGPRSGDVAPVRNVGVGYRLCMGATRQPEAQVSLLAEPRLFWPGHCQEADHPKVRQEPDPDMPARRCPSPRPSGERRTEVSE